VKRDTLQGMILNEVTKGAPLYTDQHASYWGLEKEFAHEIVNHMTEYMLDTYWDFADNECTLPTFVNACGRVSIVGRAEDPLAAVAFLGLMGKDMLLRIDKLQLPIKLSSSSGDFVASGAPSQLT
jgi:hypothetical protein